MLRLLRELKWQTTWTVPSARGYQLIMQPLILFEISSSIFCEGALFGFLTNVYKINVKTQEDPQNLRPCMVTLGPGTQLETLHIFFLFSGSHQGFLSGVF